MECVAPHCKRALAMLQHIARNGIEAAIRGQLFPAPNSTYDPPALVARLQKRVGLGTAKSFRLDPLAPGAAPVTGIALRMQANRLTDLTLVYSHGNGEDLESASEFALMLMQAYHCDVVCYEYTGYGPPALRAKPGGGAYVPCQDALYADAEAVAKYVLDLKREVLHGKIVCVGWSLGGAMATHMARVLGPNVAGLVLLSAFSSVAGVGTHKYSKYLDLARAMGMVDIFKVYEELGMEDSACALLLVHGSADTVVPSDLSLTNERSFHGVHKERLVIEGATHTSIFDAHWDQVRHSIGEFIGNHVMSR